MTDIKMIRGDTAVFDVPVLRFNPTTGVDEPVDLTGAIAWFTAKRRRSDPDSQAVIRKDSAGDLGITEHVIRIVLNPEDTAAIEDYRYLHYDVQIKESDDTVTTVELGVIELEDDITRVTVITP